MPDYSIGAQLGAEIAAERAAEQERIRGLWRTDPELMRDQQRLLAESEGLGGGRPSFGGGGGTGTYPVTRPLPRSTMMPSTLGGTQTPMVQTTDALDLISQIAMWRDMAKRRDMGLALSNYMRNQQGAQPTSRLGGR